MKESQKDIRACCRIKTRAFVRKALGVSKTTLCDWHNGNKPISLEVWFKAAKLLEELKNNGVGEIPLKKLRRMTGQLWLHLQERDPLHGSPLPSGPNCEDRDYFKKLQQGILEWDAKVAATQYRSNEGQKRGLKVPNSESSKQERYIFIIKSQGLVGGKDKFYKAEKILLKKREDLMEAVHTGLIRMHCAHQLLSFSRDIAFVKLAEGRAAVLAFLKEERRTAKNKI